MDSECDQIHVLETFQEALKYYEKLSDTFKLIGKGYSSALQKINILEKQARDGGNCSCGHLSELAKKNEELRLLREELESKRKIIVSLEAENANLCAKVKMFEASPNTSPSPRKEKAKFEQKALSNSLASGIVRKHNEEMEIKVTGDKNYEEEYFQPNFDDNSKSLQSSRKRKKLMSPVREASVDFGEDSLSMLINMMEKSADHTKGLVGAKPNGKADQDKGRLKESKVGGTERMLIESSNIDYLMELFSAEAKPAKKPASEPAKPKEIQEVRVCKKRSERNQLKGIACKECENYYAVFGEEKGRELCQKCSKHRENIPETNTPDDFYDIEIK